MVKSKHSLFSKEFQNHPNIDSQPLIFMDGHEVPGPRCLRTFGWFFFNGKCRYIRQGSRRSVHFFKAHARRNVCMAVEIPLLAKFGYEANEESVHQHSILVKRNISNYLAIHTRTQIFMGRLPGFEMDRTPINYPEILRVIFCLGMVK